MKNLRFDVILTTTDYSIFRKLIGNRPLNELKVKRFMVAFKKRQLPWYAILNENFEVIDGQHKIEACIRLGLPIPYMLKLGYGLKEAQEYNEIGGSWTKQEYLISYVELGMQSYVWLDEMMKMYPEYNLGSIESILTNTYDGSNTSDGSLTNTKGLSTGKRLAFQQGLLNLTMADKILAYDNIAKIDAYKKYFKKYNTGVFIRTMLSLFKNDKFDNDRMLQKISNQPTKMQQCSNVKLYKLMLQDIYNFASKNRLSLYP